MNETMKPPKFRVATCLHDYAVRVSVEALADQYSDIMWSPIFSVIIELANS